MNKQQNLLIVPAFNQAPLIEARLDLLQSIGLDILLIDDGSTDNTPTLLQENDWIHCIRHELNLGIGACVISGYKFAHDLGYETIIIVDPAYGNFSDVVSQILDNTRYGYDIVNCSRILENYDHQLITKERIETASVLSSRILDCTGFDITDPLSGIIGFRTAALMEMELTDSGHGLFLQLFIQADYFGLSVIEIPSSTGSRYGDELDIYEDPLGHFLAVLETERHLYPKKSMN